MGCGYRGASLAAVLLFGLCASLASAGDYAVLVAGSNDFDNYRHQADVMHAYHALVRLGMPAENIITMTFDDIAWSEWNPVPGQVFNRPTADGWPGYNVYAGFRKDYVGENVTAANFLNVLVGNDTGVGPVLHTGPDDDVFVYYADHGAVGVVEFPTGPDLHASQLHRALQEMRDLRMYRRVVFYMEACESGSMFDGWLPWDSGVYAVTAATAHEPSWGTFCPPDDVVDGVAIGSCLGDEFSVAWIQNADVANVSETLEQQYDVVRQDTSRSHVTQYGDLSFRHLPIADFEIFNRAPLRPPTNAPAATTVGAMVKGGEERLAWLEARVMRAQSEAERIERLQAVADELEARADTERFFHSLAATVANGSNSRTDATDGAVSEGAVTGQQVRRCQESGCCPHLHEAIRTRCPRARGFHGYALQFERIVVRVCESLHHTLATDPLRARHLRCHSAFE